MSKNLRVIFLSVLVVVLVASSAFALTNYEIRREGGAEHVYNKDTGVLDDNAATFTAAGLLTIEKDGHYSFADNYGAITINTINFGTANVNNAVLVVPAPTPDLPSNGTGGTWNINWPAQVKGKARNLNNRLAFTIEKRGTNSALLATAFAWNVPLGVDFTLNAPLRVNTTTNDVLSVTLNVRDGATMTFGEEAEIFARSSIQNYPTGYTDEVPNASVYNVNPGGELIVKNTWAIRGSNLTVNVFPGVGAAAPGGNEGKRAKLTLDFPADTVLDLRGRQTASSLERNNPNGTRTVANTYTVRPDALARAIADGATLMVDGELNVVNDMTLHGYIQTLGQYNTTTRPQPANRATAPTAATVDQTRQTLFKTGEGKLTISDAGDASDNSLSNYGKWALPHALRYLNVTEGTVELASGMFTWSAGRALTTGLNPAQAPTVNINEGATFIAGSKTLEEVNNLDDAIAFNIHGTAIFKDHAIVKRNRNSGVAAPVYDEIYPYEDYITFSNGLRINARDVKLNVPSGGKVIVDNGALAVASITGEGEIEIKNTTDSRDRAVLILTDPLGEVDGAVNINSDEYALNYIDFKGKIYGQGANVGLYALTKATLPYSRRIFQSANVDIDNLIVYGPAQLNINADTKLDGVKNIWLRGHRPGAVNFTDGKVAEATAYSKLTVGRLNFIPGNTNTEIKIDGLKVDGTSNLEDIGSLTVLNVDNDAKNNVAGGVAPRNYAIALPGLNGLGANGRRLVNNRAPTGPRMNVYISHLQLYANKGTNQDFPSAYAKPATGIYALKLDGSVQPSRIFIDGTTVSGDGIKDDVSGKIYQVQIEGESDVKFTGEGDWQTYAEYYPVAHNNSILVKQNAKLEIVRGGIVDGNLAFEPSGLAAVAPFDLDASGAIDNDELGLALGEWPDFTDANYYPRDVDFYADDALEKIGRWYRRNANTGRIRRYTTFSTQVGADNRRISDTGNDTSDYAVKVTGDLLLSMDNTTGYLDTGKVLVRAKPDIDAFDGYEFTTIGQRFKTLGTTGGADNYEPSFATSFNSRFQFRVSALNADRGGVTAETRTELAIVKLGEWSFMSGDANFGLGTGHNFSIKVPFKVIIRGQELTLKKDIAPTDNSIHYYVEIDQALGQALGLGSGKYYFTPVAGFVSYKDGEELIVEDNVGDANDNAFPREGVTPEFVSSDITLRAEVDITDSGDQFVRIIGSSYVNPAKNIRLRLDLNNDNLLTSTVNNRGVITYAPNGLVNTLTWLNGAVPAFRVYEFSRGGGTGGNTPAPTTSPDVPAPTSPDNPAPVSPDNPAPVSPDNPAPTPDNPTPAPAAFAIDLSDGAANTMDEASYSLVDRRTYTLTFTAGTASASAFRTSAGTTWSVSKSSNMISDLVYSSTTGDTFTVEVVAKAKAEDADDEDQTFTVTATNGSDTATHEVTFSVEAEDEEIKSAYTTLSATSGSHDDVKAGYRVDFPAGVTADAEYVFLPSWLKVRTNDDDEVIGVEFNDAAPIFDKGTTATVTVEEAENEDGDTLRYQWDVVYGAASGGNGGNGNNGNGNNGNGNNGNGNNGGTTSPDVPSPTSPDTPAPTSGDHTVSSSSSSGCDAGFGAFALLFAAPLFLRRRRS